MLWLVLAVAAGLLAYLLLRAMRGYERESAAAALEEVRRLKEVTENLERRVQNLEAIATRVDAEVDSAEMPADSVPSPERRVKS